MAALNQGAPGSRSNDLTEKLTAALAELVSEYVPKSIKLNIF